MSEDYYSILGVNKSSSQDDIKKAYRKLAKKHHPDKNAGDSASEDKFKKINEAYETLSNEDKKRSYDNPHSRGFGSMGNFGDFASHFGFGSGNRRHDAPRKGNDLQDILRVSIYDVVKGTNKKVKASFKDICTACNGTGAEKMNHCEDCNGNGMIQRVVQRGNSRMASMQPCHKCQGVGKIKIGKCSKCINGQVDAKVSVSLAIPKGVEHGSVLRIVGKGMSGIYGGPKGDFYVKLHLDLPDYSKLTKKEQEVLETISGKL